MTLSRLKTSLSEIPRLNLFLSLLAVACSYWLSAYIEIYAVLESGLKISRLSSARVSFVSRAIGSVAGAAAVSGASFRYRYYSRFGAKPSQVGRIIVSTQLSSLAGTAGLIGAVFLFGPSEITESIKFPSWARYSLAFAALSPPAFSLLVSNMVKKERFLPFEGILFPSPSRKACSVSLPPLFAERP